MESEVAVFANRQRFVAELRSGKYHQVFGKYLDYHNKDCLCAVGVAAVACGVERVDTGYQMEGDESVWAFDEVVEPIVSEKLGITKSAVRAIVSMNDDDRMSFSEIADKLEEQWSLK